MISGYFQCLYLMYSEVAWLLVSSETQVQPQIILEPDYLPHYISVSYEYNHIMVVRFVGPKTLHYLANAIVCKSNVCFICKKFEVITLLFVISEHWSAKKGLNNSAFSLKSVKNLFPSVFTLQKLYQDRPVGFWGDIMVR